MNIEIEFKFKIGDIVASRSEMAEAELARQGASGAWRRPPVAMTILAFAPEVAGRNVCLVYIVAALAITLDGGRVTMSRTHVMEAEIVAYPEPGKGK